MRAALVVAVSVYALVLGAPATEAEDKTVVVTNGADQPVPVTVQNTPAGPRPFQKLVYLTIPAGFSYASATVNVPEDEQITIEKVGLAVGRNFSNITVVELCDFSDGQTGFGGAVFVPLAPMHPDALYQAIDHSTLLHLSAGACYEVSVRLAEELADYESIIFPVTLSGTSVAVSPAGAPSNATGDLERSRQDPAYQSIRRSMLRNRPQQ